MIKAIATRLTLWAVSNEIVEKENDDIYQYGAELMISNVFGISIGITMSIFAGKFIEALVFIFLFSVLRQVTGGHHANTYLACISTFSAIVAVFLAVVLLLPTTLYIYCIIVTSSISLLLIFLLAPVAHENKPISKSQRPQLRRNSLIFSIMISAIAILWIAFLPIYNTIPLTISLAQFGVCMSLAYASHITRIKEVKH